MQVERINIRIISPQCSILEAMKKMDEIKMKVLFVFTENKFEGILTLGDLQRAIIKGSELTDIVLHILDPKKIYADVSESIDSVKRKMAGIRAECMPVVRGNELVDVYT